MEPVRSKEKQAELIAHWLDDAFLLPGTAIRFGLDPIIGIIPVFGDALATAIGAAILLNARQLGVPVNVLGRMASNLLINGVIGAIPAFGDLFSFWFKSHSKNTALLLRAVAKGDNGTSCSIAAPPLTVRDLALVLAITAPIVVFVGYISFLLWEREVSMF
ncbi:MAG: DUF4112 domain-containing protein [Nitrospiraceae bacterium]